MREGEFKGWLKDQGLASTTISTQLSKVRKLDRHFGELDDLYRQGGFPDLDVSLQESPPSDATLALGNEGERRHLRTSLRYYRRFLEAEGPAGAGGYGLSRQDILDAIERCDGFDSVEDFIASLEGLGQPKQYWLLHDGKRYPSKAIVRDALAHIGSEALPGGGQCKRALDALGFPVLDWPAFQEMRTTFLARMEDFGDFQARSGGYWDCERAYKNEVIDEVQAISASDLGDKEAGEAIFRTLSVGRQGLPLGWRTLAEFRKATPELRDRIHEIVGVLARAEGDVGEAIEYAAQALEQLRHDGIAGLRRGAVLAIAVSVAATMHPDEASWFKITRIEAMGERLFGRRLFAHPQFDLADFEEYRQLMRALFDLMEKELRWYPSDLFDVQGFIWVALSDTWDADEEEPASGTPAPAELQGAYWFVGASYGGRDDQAERFVAEGIWHVSEPTDRQRDQVREMRPGERIAIKATFTQRHDLPFDNRGRVVSVMKIKARGTIVENPGDGENLVVEWEQGFEPRDWYFYTYQPTIWLVRSGKEMSDRLIRFAFFDEPQDIEWFQRNLRRWQEVAPVSGESALPDPTNLILYGPPGTGKTWRVMAEAVRLADGLDEADPLLQIGQRDLLKARYDELSEAGRLAFVTFHQNFAYEEFVEGLRPRPIPDSAGFALLPEAGVFRRVAENALESNEAFVIVIDEINRANISKVFGELITLIEADKRIGGENALLVTLPYSGARFGVPRNLHIIGTMNTADRSIALLDTALRRRFRFQELMPDPALLSADLDGIDVRAVLTGLNERIEFLFDRDHQIGHAYFIGCVSRSDLDEVMRTKVIPLLVEYFYEDWEKVRLVLGETNDNGAFVSRRLLSPPAGFDSDFGGERWRYSVNETFHHSAYGQLGA